MEGLACADPGARTPIGAIEFFSLMHTYKHIHIHTEQSFISIDELLIYAIYLMHFIIAHMAKNEHGQFNISMKCI